MTSVSTPAFAAVADSAGSSTDPTDGFSARVVNKAWAFAHPAEGIHWTDVADQLQEARWCSCCSNQRQKSGEAEEDENHMAAFHGYWLCQTGRSWRVWEQKEKGEKSFES